MLEKRYIPAGLELRQEDDGRRIISGYAAVYGKESEDLGGFREVLREGAFARALKKKPDVKCLLNHDPNHILGRTKNRTLTLEDTPVGLRFEAEVPDTVAGRDAYTLVERGDIDQCSFAFSVAKNGDKWTEREGTYLREIVEIGNLSDVSLVVYPAYPDTSAETRNKEVLDSYLSDLRAQEQAEKIAEGRATRKRKVALLK